MLQPLDELAARYAGRAPEVSFDAIRAQLAAEQGPVRRRLLESGLTDAVADELRTVRTEIDDWSPRRDGWRALEPGLDRGYRRARRAFRLVRRKPTPENLHDWRKRTKDLWYHLRLLKALSPSIIGGYADETHGLADLLGDDHDLALLRERLRTGTGELAVDVDAVIELIDHRREQLQAKALRIGARVYAERPKRFVRRMHRDWNATRAGTPHSAPRA